MPDTTYRVAVIPGDGIGREVVPAAQEALEAVGERFGFRCDWTVFGWSCELYARTGSMTGEGAVSDLAGFDAIFLGAIGFPGVPDPVSLWGLLIPIRRQFRQYVNLRPVRLLPGVRTPLADRGPADIDFLIVRENNEGEYSEIGGASTRAPRMSWQCSRRLSPGWGSTGCCAMRSNVRARGRRVI